MPAQVDGSGAVLNGLVEGAWAGAGQVEPGLLCVAVQHCNTGGGTGGALAGRESKEGAECEIIRDVEDTRLLLLLLLTLSVLLLRVEELQARAGGQQPLASIQTGSSGAADLLCRKGALCAQQRIEHAQFAGGENHLGHQSTRRSYSDYQVNPRPYALWAFYVCLISLFNTRPVI